MGLPWKDRPNGADGSAPGAGRSPRLIRRVIVLVVALCLLGGAAASAATLASSDSAAAPAAPAASGTTVSAAVSASQADAAAVPAGTLSVAGSATLAAGSSVTFNYTASTANSENWIGIYQAGQTPGSTGSTVWAYAPNASGSLTLSGASLAPGTWDAYLLYDNGYGVMAGPVALTVTASGTIAVDGQASVVDGLKVSFDYTANPANAENWIGIYKAGDSDLHDYLTYNYTGGASGTTVFSTASLQPGHYQAVLLYDNGYTALAGPVTFTVTPAPVVPQPVYQSTLTSIGGASLAAPSGVAVDASGDVWATDAVKDQVVEFSPKGLALRAFGGAGSGNGKLDEPEALAVSGGDVYVADTGNNRVEEFTAGGAFVRVIGGPGTGDGEFTSPEGIAVDSAGTIYVADTAGNRIEEFSQSGAFTKSVTASVSSPQGLAVDSAGDLWVADNGYTDAGGDNVLEYGPSGSLLNTLGSSESANYGGMSNPADVALDASGNVYVAEPDYDLVQEFNVDSLYEGEFGTPATDKNGNLSQAGTAVTGGGGGTLYLPESVAIGSDGQVYVADRGNHRIAEFEQQVPAAVVTQPASVTTFAGFPAFFHAEAAGVPRPTVQWESEAPGAASFTPIAGATSDTLVVGRTTAAATGTKYAAVFKNATGTVTTATATLTVKPIPKPAFPPNHPGGPGAPGLTSWPSAPTWATIFTWPGIPAWPAAPVGRPAAPGPSQA